MTDHAECAADTWVFNDEDISWLSKNGRVRKLTPGSILIREGVHSEAIYILLEGEASVSVEGIGNVAQLNHGQFIGEMSLVDKSPPSATVASARLPLSSKSTKLSSTGSSRPTPGLQAASIRPSPCFLPIASAARHGSGNPAAGGLDEDELDESVLDGVTVAGLRYQNLVETLKGGRN